MLVTLSEHVADPARLAALRAVALLDTPTEESFDRLTWVATRAVNAPVSLVSLIDSDRQFFKSCIGLPEPWQSRRETPLSHSFCQHNRVPKVPLVIPDARLDPLFKDNAAIRDLNVIAYMGVPLVTSDNYVLGSFCVIDSKPRHWTEDEIGIVDRLSSAVMTEIQLRTEIGMRTTAEELLRTRNDELHSAYRDLKAETNERIETLEQLHQRDQLLIRQSRLAVMGETMRSIAHEWRQPLNVIGLHLQRLLIVYDKGKFDREFLRETTETAMNLIRQMSETVEDFWNFFKPAQDKTDFSLDGAIAKTVSFVKDALQSSQIEIVTDLQSAVDITGYFNEFCQALLNIIQNARDALLERRVANGKISITSAVTGGRPIVTIADNAGGIDKVAMEHIFEPYFSTKGVQGSGIGLYMTKAVIESSMGGRIGVYNNEEGAVFTIQL